MSRGTIVFVHGTGVRLKSYERGVENAMKIAAAADVTERFEKCAWGDPLGVEFDGKSLPDPPSPEKLKQEEEDFAQWIWLFDDPLFELNQLTLQDTSHIPKSTPIPGEPAEWEMLWDQIAAYAPSPELQKLLERGGLQEYWSSAWSQIVTLSEIPKNAFEASQHELAEAANALARALIAQLHITALIKGTPGPSQSLRTSLRDCLMADWNQQVYARGAFLVNFFKRAVTRSLRKHREGLSDSAALPVGDILLYQSRGGEVRDFIREKIEKAKPPVTVVGHSLGGIACVDLLALPRPPRVHRLVTAGSQAPLLYEIGALRSLKPPEPLPNDFPKWLNFYDRNDFLSYVARRLWPGGKVDDFEIESGDPFPDSHSAYFGNQEVWSEIRKFIDK